MWKGLEHSVWKTLSKLDLRNRNLCLCCSGGADSVALFWVLKKLKIKFTVIHFHHGLTEDKRLNRFRNKAQNFVHNLCKTESIRLEEFKSSRGLLSEEECRNFRNTILKKIAKNSWILMAHHRDDLLETRLIRLIRGTGPEGLKSMQIKRGVLIRPFLHESANSIRQYLVNSEKKWLEDPSNQNSKYLRNWIRNQWLPSLEARQQGSVNRLSLSLESLSHKKQPQGLIKILRKKAVKTDFYWTLSESEQIQALAMLLKSNGVVTFSLSQIKEAQRRIFEQKSREMSFKIAQINWHVNAEQIHLQI